MVKKIKNFGGAKAPPKDTCGSATAYIEQCGSYLDKTKPRECIS